MYVSFSICVCPCIVRDEGKGEEVLHLTGRVKGRREDVLDCNSIILVHRLTTHHPIFLNIVHGKLESVRVYSADSNGCRVPGLDIGL